MPARSAMAPIGSIVWARAISRSVGINILVQVNEGAVGE
jgi:hypothetical protein